MSNDQISERLEPSHKYYKRGKGWIKEANKLGEYRNTYHGFRIYTTVKPTSSQEIICKDGSNYLKTIFTRGEYIAIDRYGVTYKGYLNDVIAKIDNDYFQSKF